MGLIEGIGTRYHNPSAYTSRDVLKRALVQDRGKDGKIEDVYYAASLNRLFAYANFPRDMLRAVRDVHAFMPEKRSEVIRTLVMHQGFGRDDLQEKQTGRFHHEHRKNIEGARSREFVEIFDEEQKKWSHLQPGKHIQTLTYYGAADTTADGFSAIAEEALSNPHILSERVRNDDLKKEITIAKGAQAAIDWVTNTILYGPVTVHKHDMLRKTLQHRRLDRFLPFYENQVLRRVDWTTTRARELLRRRVRRKPREYLLESQRVNGLGILFQNITDGGLSTMHVDPDLEGLLGNYHKPIAYLEVQLSAINALNLAAHMYPKRELFYKNLAQKMRESVMRQFYMPDKKYFAAAVDRDERTGKYRKVEAFSIMGASVLSSDLFDTMAVEEKRRYIEPIIERLSGPDFMTEAGVRTKAKQYAKLTADPLNPHVNVAAYQDGWNVWPALNEDYALGLRKQGFHDLAEQVENRMINFVRANSNAEFAFVVPGEITVNNQQINLDGLVAQNYKTQQEFDALTNQEKARLIGTKQLIYLKAPYPQGDQLWTASAVERILYERRNHSNKHTDPLSWQHEVENHIFQHADWKSVPILEGEQLDEYADNEYFFIIDPQEAIKIEDTVRNLSEQKRKQQLTTVTKRAIIQPV